ncbi:hypothetical protein ACQ4PT_051484 [Festuca glaucescens]
MSDDRADDGETMETAMDGGEDRIGALPDDLLKYLMSFLLSREAVRTCVLAKRWRTLWKSVPALRIDDPESYEGAHGSSTFVDELIRLRDPTPLNACDISSVVPDGPGSDFDQSVEEFRRMEPWLQYALSCRVQEQHVTETDESYNSSVPSIISKHLKAFISSWRRSVELVYLVPDYSNF